MYDLSVESFVAINTIGNGELFEMAGGLCVRIDRKDGFWGMCITPPTESPMNDDRLKQADEFALESGCPVGKVALNEQS